MTAPAPAMPRQLKLNPSYAQAFNDRGLEFSSKGEFDKAIADYNQSIKINPNAARGLLQSRQRLLRQARSQQGARRLRCRDQARSEERAGLLRPRLDLLRSARLRPRHRRLRFRHQARSEGRVRLLQPRPRAVRPPRFRPRHRRLLAGDQARRQDRARLPQSRQRLRAQARLRQARSPISTRRSSSTATTRWPSTIAASPTAPRAISTAPSRTSIRPSRSIPKSAPSYTNRGVAYSVKGDIDRAFADYEQAIKLNPSYAFAFYNRGNALLRQGRLRQGHRELQRGGQAQSEPIRVVYHNRGNAYANKRDIDRAIADQNQAIKLNAELCARLQRSRPRLRRARRRRQGAGGFRPVDQARSEEPAGVLQSRPDAAQPRRSRPRHRRFRRRDQAQSELHGRALRARQRLSDQARLRPRHRRSRSGDQAQPGSCGGLRRPRRWPMACRATPTAPSPTSSQAIKLDPNDALAFSNRGFAWRTKGDIVRADRRLRAGDQARSGAARRPSTTAATPITRSATYDRAIADFDAGAEDQSELCRSRSTTAASPIATRATTTAPSPTSARWSQLDPKNAQAFNNRWAWPIAARAISTARSQASSRRSSSTPAWRWPSTTAARPTA